MGRGSGCAGTQVWRLVSMAEASDLGCPDRPSTNASAREWALRSHHRSWAGMPGPCWTWSRCSVALLERLLPCCVGRMDPHKCCTSCHHHARKRNCGAVARAKRIRAAVPDRSMTDLPGSLGNSGGRGARSGPVAPTHSEVEMELPQIERLSHGARCCARSYPRGCERSPRCRGLVGLATVPCSRSSVCNSSAPGCSIR